MHYFYFIYTDYYFEAKYKVYGKDFLFYLKSYNFYCVEAKYKVYGQSIHILFYICSQQVTGQLVLYMVNSIFSITDGRVDFVLACMPSDAYWRSLRLCRL